MGAAVAASTRRGCWVPGLSWELGMTWLCDEHLPFSPWRAVRWHRSNSLALHARLLRCRECDRACNYFLGTPVFTMRELSGSGKASGSEGAGDKSTLEYELCLLFSPWKLDCHSAVIASKSSYGCRQKCGDKKNKIGQASLNENTARSSRIVAVISLFFAVPSAYQFLCCRCIFCLSWSVIY